MSKFLIFFLIFFNLSSGQTYSIFKNFETNRSCLENDSTGNLLRNQYDEIYRITDIANYFMTKINGKYGLISKEGETVLDNIYDNIYVTKCDITTIKGDDKKVIIIDENCKLKNFIITKKEKKYGVLNHKSELIIPYKYDFINPYGIVYQNEKAGLIDSLGNDILETKFENIFKFSTTIVGNCSYKRKECDENDWYVVTMKSNDSFLSGIVDSHGKYLVPLAYENIIGIVNKEKLIPAKKNGKYGFIDINNQIKIPFVYDRVSEFKDGLASVELNHKTAMINTDNRIIIPFDSYDDFFFKFRNNVSVFSTNRNTKYGLINNKGKIITQTEYDEIISINDSEYYFAKKNGKAGILNYDGKIIIPFLYEHVRISKCQDNELFIATSDKKSGIINVKNEILVPFLYDYIAFTNGIISLPKSNLLELMNCNFKLITKTKFKKYTVLNPEKISVQDESGSSYNIDRNGKITTNK